MSDLILYRENALASPASSSTDVSERMLEQTRFFLPRELLVSRHGIVAMLVADSRPETRCVTYSDGEWSGIKVSPPTEWDEWAKDPIRRAHYADTEKGCSLIRVFALPKAVTDIFAGDKYLGDPMIRKCACDGAFDKGVIFDEEEGRPDFRPISEAMPIIESAAKAGWKAAGLNEPEMNKYWQIWSWVSFHGWVFSAPAVDQAQNALERAIVKFDEFLQRFDPQYVVKYGAPTRDTSAASVVQTTAVPSGANPKLIP